MFCFASSFRYRSLYAWNIVSHPLFENTHDKDVISAGFDTVKPLTSGVACRRVSRCEFRIENVSSYRTLTMDFAPDYSYRLSVKLQIIRINYPPGLFAFAYFANSSHLLEIRHSTVNGFRRIVCVFQNFM